VTTNLFTLIISRFDWVYKNEHNIYWQVRWYKFVVIIPWRWHRNMVSKHVEVHVRHVCCKYVGGKNMHSVGNIKFFKKRNRSYVVLNNSHKCCWLPLTLTLTFPGVAGEDGGSGGGRPDRRAGCDLHARVSPVRVPMWQRPLCASQPLLWCCEWLRRLFRWATLVYT